MSLRAKRKITHKELKKDKLVTAYFNAREWIDKEENKKKLYMGGGVILAIILFAYFYLADRSRKNEEAETKLSAVINLYEQGKYQEAINGDPSSNITGLLQIVNDYGSTNSGETAKMYLANCYYNLREYDNALNYFESYDGNNDIIKASCLSGIGAVYEAKGDNRKAAEYFEKAANVNKDVVINQENLYYAIKAYTNAGDKENARRLYSQLREEYPRSRYINDAKRLESEFKN